MFDSFVVLPEGISQSSSKYHSDVFLYPIFAIFSKQLFGISMLDVQRKDMENEVSISGDILFHGAAKRTYAEYTLS